MKKRFEFKCWNCHRTYTLFREITDEQVLAVACPYCSKEGVVALEPYRRPKPIDVHKGVGNKPSLEIDELDLPDILPTQKPE
jgi:DNA-directed RNA polymerase subunit RPC12/RpoP